ncbi:hypothetical protein [Buttiauxella agrestis]|uniref:hypothetical protein n=1 Tax=Buttiauxella agrestis TaxID=82977 RepID=UPI00397600E8
MEEKSANAANRKDLHSQFVYRTLKSWRFFLLFTVPPMMWAMFFASPSLYRISIVLLCGIVWFGCWRLWLDTQYLELINEENNHHAGEALGFIWRREKLKAFSLAERQRGAFKLLRQTILFTVALWVNWLIALF